MKSLNHAKIIDALEQALLAHKDAFIFAFLLAYNTPKATIDRLKHNDVQRNVAKIAGDIALPRSLYFRAVAQGTSVSESLSEILALPDIARHKIPFVMVTDFVSVAAYDCKFKDMIEFDFGEFKSHYEFFLPMTGNYEKPIAYAEHPADVKASEKMGRLYDSICTVNHYEKDALHTLNVFLARLLFCFFAEDTGIFPKPNQMTEALQALTQESGADVSAFFESLFDVLNLPNDAPERQTFSTTFQAFPYVNGGLFVEKCAVPQFNAKSRRLLIECGNMAWSDISPVIFGSMFQAVMIPEKRRSMGAHYTSEKNILKVLRPLFLDALHEEFEGILALKKGKKQRLNDFRIKLSALGFLDPACGCGNFLIIAYRELKDLELKTLLALKKEEPKMLVLDVKLLSKVSINQFYGIELEEFPAEIARVSMWLMEHVMNVKFGTSLGHVIPSIPLIHSAKIVCANALTTPWENVVPPEKLNYIMGNPPFGGRRSRTTKQHAEIAMYFPVYKDVDYVACWFKRAAIFSNKYGHVAAAFVATNSITQGEQVYHIWNDIVYTYNIKINFAFKTFKWKNEAKNNAVVHCVIVGFSKQAHNIKKIFYEDGSMRFASNISPYIIDADDVLIAPLSKPICYIPAMQNGNVPLDGDALKIELNDYGKFIDCKYIKRLMGGEELLKNKERYVLWLVNVKYDDIKFMPNVLERVTLCKKRRLDMSDASSRALASTPMTFRDTNNPKKYIAMPMVSSENRNYIPMAYLTGDTIPTNQLQTIPNATLYHFGILTSAMHMAWMRTVCGRLEMRYRYSASIVYNTFPWPSATESQQKAIEALAEEVLLAREDEPDMTLAQLYNPETMPALLFEKHKALDLAVDALYRPKPFADDEERLQLLFALYEKLVKEKPATHSAVAEEEEGGDD